eukprot:5876345-Amphidinium_carterae.1
MGSKPSTCCINAVPESQTAFLKHFQLFLGIYTAMKQATTRAPDEVDRKAWSAIPLSHET